MGLAKAHIQTVNNSQLVFLQKYIVKKITFHVSWLSFHLLAESDCGLQAHIHILPPFCQQPTTQSSLSLALITSFTQMYIKIQKEYVFDEAFYSDVQHNLKENIGSAAFFISLQIKIFAIKS